MCLEEGSKEVDFAQPLLFLEVRNQLRHIHMSQLGMKTALLLVKGE